MSDTHHGCQHYHVGVGCVYCPRTKAVYVQPEMVPTEAGRKTRGGPADVFARRVRQIEDVLSFVKVLGYIMLVKGVKLPLNGRTVGDVILLRQRVNERAEREGKTP